MSSPEDCRYHQTLTFHPDNISYLSEGVQVLSTPLRDGIIQIGTPENLPKKQLVVATESSGLTEVSFEDGTPIQAEILSTAPLPPEEGRTFQTVFAEPVPRLTYHPPRPYEGKLYWEVSGEGLYVLSMPLFDILTTTIGGYALRKSRQPVR